jgi:hypothetical protein
MLVVGKFIAYTTYRVEIYRVFRIGLKIFTKRKDKVINGTGTWVHIIIPNGFQYLLSGYGLVTGVLSAILAAWFLFW